jgi:aminoglycoside phosphotransferase (APT) family kinase protein
MIAEDVAQALDREGYALERVAFQTKRPDRSMLALTRRDGLHVVAKIYADGDGGEAYANMVAAWRSSFGERRRPPGLPEPLGYDVERRVLLMERIEGHPWLELGPWDAHLLDEAVRVLASLHDSDAAPARRRTSSRIVASVRRKATAAAALEPALVPQFHEAAEALAARSPPDGELVPSHGDFNPRNVLVGKDRTVLIDWDRFQLADPARDVASLGAWFWLACHRERTTPTWAPLERAATLYERLRPGAALRERLDFHTSAALVRRAFSRVDLWRSEVRFVPALLSEAMRRLA